MNNGFDDWFNELVGYSFRSEWFYDDFDYAAKTNDYKKIVKWLQEAYEMGYNAGIQNYGGTE